MLDHREIAEENFYSYGNPLSLFELRRAREMERIRMKHRQTKTHCFQVVKVESYKVHKVIKWNSIRL